MEITEKYIDKQIDYLNNFEQKKYEKLFDTIVEEQLLLSSFMQKNLDIIFPEDKEQIKEFTYNIYFLILFILKSKLKDKYFIIDNEKLDKVLKLSVFENPYEDLGDFIFTQFISEGYEKDDILKAINLLNVIIACFSIKS